MCCMFFVCLFVLSFYFSKHQLIVSIIMVMRALNCEEVTTKRRPERLIEPNIQYFLWEDKRDPFSKAWSQDCFGNWDGNLRIMARNESGERSRNEIMMGLLSLAKTCGVFPESSRETLKVYLEHNGTPLAALDLKQTTRSLRNSLIRTESTKGVTKFFKEKSGLYFI